MSFVLDQIEDVNLERRAGLYRDLAEIASSPEEKERLSRLAVDCDAIAHSHAQLVLDFKRRSA